MTTYVLYHASCLDGLGAKYAAWTRFKDEATYISVQYGQPFPSDVKISKDSSIYILDFSYPRQVLLDIVDKVGGLLVLDHHKTAQADLADLPFATFNMNKSGAVLAWEYFNPGKPIPGILKYIQDGDLWKFTYPETEFVRAAFPLISREMVEFNEIATNPRALHDLIESGRTLCKARDQSLVSSVPSKVKVVSYRGFKAGVINATHLVSELGNEICKNEELDVHLAILFFYVSENSGPGSWVLSFRSSATSEVDVSLLAKDLGGGGHKNAAGAKVDLSFLTLLLENKL